MQVTGYQLREAIKRWEMRKDTTAKQWDDALWTFEGEKKTTPTDLADQYSTADANIALLQTAQTRYNLLVAVKVQGKDLSLSEAVKRVGGAGRLEKMWRSFATNNGRDRYSRLDNERKKDSEYAKRTVTAAECLKKATVAAQYAGALRAAIAEGNSSKVDMAQIGLDLKLLE